MSTNIDKVYILNELKKHYKFKSDAEFSRHLGIKPQTFASWLKRNTYDLDLVYAKCNEISAEWLLTGKGTMLKKAGTTKLESTAQIIDVKDELIELQRELIDVLKKENSDLKKIIQQIKPKG